MNKLFGTLLLIMSSKAISAQMVTVESFFPQPTCVNDMLVYNCQTNFLSFLTTWRHTAFDSLRYFAGTEQSTLNTSDGRVVANFATNGGPNAQQTVVSTLTILPPLNNFNGTNLNGTNVTCQGLFFLSTSVVISGDAPILLVGEPSPPDNLRGGILGDTPSVKIEWDPPLYTGGNGISILMYRITILETDYEEESNTTRSHTITADSTNVMFNIPYEVEVTAINTCGDESTPASQTIIIEASGPPEVSFLTVVIVCNVGAVRNVDLQWEFKNSSFLVYTPPIEAVTVEIDGPAPVSANECSDLTPSDRSCNFNITNDGIYTVTLNTINVVGTTSHSMIFDSNPLLVDDSPLTDTPPHVLVSVNTLCQDDEHIITVLFGTRPIGMMMECAFQQLSVLTDKDMVPTTIEPSGWQIYVPENIVLDEGEEYCYRVLLGAFQGVIDVQEEVKIVVVDGVNGSKSIAMGSVASVVAGGYGLYVLVGSASATIIFWLLPIVAGLSTLLIVLMSVGVVVSVAVFPIGLVLLIAVCCCCRRIESGHKWNYSSSPISTILCYIGIVTSIAIYPVGVVALVLYFLQSKVKAQGVLITAGIVGSVVVFPIGLALLFASCCCCHGKKAKKQFYMQFNDIPDWLKALIYIGGVASIIIPPLGASILIYHYCKEKENGIFEETRHQVVSGHEMTEVSYNTSYDLVISWKSDPDTSGNIAYGDHQGIPTKDNPAYGQVQM